MKTIHNATAKLIRDYLPGQEENFLLAQNEDKILVLNIRFVGCLEELLSFQCFYIKDRRDEFILAGPFNTIDEARIAFDKF